MSEGEQQPSPPPEAMASAWARSAAGDGSSGDETQRDGAAQLTKRPRFATSEDDGPAPGAEGAALRGVNSEFHREDGGPEIGARPDGSTHRSRPDADAAGMASAAPQGDPRSERVENAHQARVENAARAMCMLPQPTEPSDISPAEQGEPRATTQGDDSGAATDSLASKVAANRRHSLQALQALGFLDETSGLDRRMPQSQFKGCYYVLGGRWESKITYKSKTRHIGTFDSEIEAALAFDAKAHELGVPQRSNFLYDEHGNLRTDGLQGARRSRSRVSSRSSPGRGDSVDSRADLSPATTFHEMRDERGARLAHYDERQPPPWHYGVPWHGVPSHPGHHPMPPPAQWASPPPNVPPPPRGYDGFHPHEVYAERAPNEYRRMQQPGQRVMPYPEYEYYPQEHPRKNKFHI
mmetsp:Transcript_592/g.1743  ORF Transcript_592/g.1743 Transcript_592/m.1743 type:complete len:409 (-) Transcript_592:445-1671(-)